MSKTPLIERMTKGGAAKTWIKEVETKNKCIERLLELKEEYLNVIDLLACEKELLTKNVQDGRYAHSVIRECHRELEEENEAMVEASEALLDAIHTHTVLGRGDWLNGLETNMEEAISKAKGD